MPIQYLQNGISCAWLALVEAELQLFSHKKITQTE